MIVQMRLNSRDATNPKVVALLEQAGWEPADNDAETDWYQIGVAMPFASKTDAEVARGMIEPFLNLGVQPLALKTLTIPLKTRISRLAMAVSREDPIEANRLYDLVDEIPADL